MITTILESLKIVAMNFVSLNQALPDGQNLMLLNEPNVKKE